MLAVIIRRLKLEASLVEAAFDWKPNTNHCLTKTEIVELRVSS